MKKFYLEPTDDLPGVAIDPELGTIDFWGQSLPEDSIQFFRPIIEAVKEYMQNPRPKTVLNLKLIYLNTSSSKKMIEISSILEAGFQDGLDIEINWICSADDEDMMDEGKEYARLVGIPVNFITE
jgi:hypothetical protein